MKPVRDNSLQVQKNIQSEIHVVTNLFTNTKIICNLFKKAHTQPHTTNCNEY